MGTMYLCIGVAVYRVLSSRLAFHLLQQSFMLVSTYVAADFPQLDCTLFTDDFPLTRYPASDS